MASSFFAFISRMKYINRWGLMKNTSSENLKEHSFDVALISHSLAVISNTFFGGNINPDKIAVLALYHDCSEIITGDMPTPVKYFSSSINIAYREVEAIAKSNILSKLPNEFKPLYSDIINYEESLPEYKKLIKGADTLSAYIKCLEELKSGNLEFLEAKETIKNKLTNMKIAEVDYFLDNFVSAFSLSLDNI